MRLSGGTTTGATRTGGVIRPTTTRWWSEFLDLLLRLLCIICFGSVDGCFLVLFASATLLCCLGYFSTSCDFMRPSLEKSTTKHNTHHIQYSAYAGRQSSYLSICVHILRAKVNTVEYASLAIMVLLVRSGKVTRRTIWCPVLARSCLQIPKQDR